MNPTAKMDSRRRVRAAGLFEDLLLTFVLVAAAVAAVVDGVFALGGSGAF